jgi:arylsulfatase A-like enzyme
MAIKTYKDGTPFTGVIGRTTEESSPAWPEAPRPPEGAPNVLFFVLDDVGYGQLSCFGGLVETPVLDSLAANGLTYNNMHTTALCSPSRGCILTGRNHHSLGLASITETSTGYPGYNGVLPFDRAMISEMLLQKGYNTFCVGKWHLTPPEHTTAAGPYDRWPLGRGFERFYGFLGGETNQWFPELTYDNHTMEPPKSPEEGYHLSSDLADKAIEFIQDAHVNAPDKPFFMYYATGAGHAPHHVPKEWADKYKGKFDMGWDKYREIVHQRQLEMGIIPAGTELSAHDPDVPVWDTLPADTRRLYARFMEVYAGFISFTDHHFGRILQFLEEIGERDNTLIMVVSDNGASSEGGPVGSLNEMFFFNNVKESLEDNFKMLDKLGGVETNNHYPWGWTNAGNTPFRRWKRETYRGGTTDPCIVSWPKGIQGKRRGAAALRARHRLGPDSFGSPGYGSAGKHPRRDQAPIDGISFAHTFNEAAATSNHHTQYFEMFGHRAIYHDGWRAVCPWPGTQLHRGSQEGTAVRRPQSTTRCFWISRPTTGSCTTWTRTTPKPRTWLPNAATS